MKILDLSLILTSVTLSSGAQFVLKLGASAPRVRAAISDGGSIFDRMLAFATTPMLLLGLTIYAVSAFTWILVLSKLDLSFAYPFVGLGFIMTFVAGTLLLGESFSVARLAGMLLIAGGTILVARSG